MNLPTCHCLMAMDNLWMAMNKWEVIELQSKSYEKDLQTTILLLKDLVRHSGMPQGSSDHLDNGGRTTFCLKVVRNRPMWQCVKLL